MLIITSKELEINKLITNDIVEIIDSRHFKWIGRKDNVINSGGIKIYPELIEKQLSKFIDINNFFIDKLSHKTFGQQVVIVMNNLVDREILLEAIQSLEKYHKPKLFYKINEFILTENNKLNRVESKKYAKKISILAK
jgi:O-succinylbenzoic acid--CoA ligase